MRIGGARGLLLQFVLLFACDDVLARGASPYLPLDMSPEFERKIERVLLLGDRPVMRRPIPAAVVLDALPQACKRDRALCEEVRSYLDSYMHKAGVTHFRASVAATDTEGETPLSNEHGLEADNAWEVRALAYFQPSDYLVLSAGGIAREEDAIATDSMISLGFDFAQLDLGYRDHWLSPLNDSSSIVSTEAPTMPSATLSNYRPLTPLGITYEVFLAEMSRQEAIQVPGGTTSGHPCLAGLQAGIAPADGYAFAVTRLTQYGGGARGSCDEGFFDALFTADNEADVEGESVENSNRVASITSSVLFQGNVPFGVHVEYAGEDNAYAGNYRLGATNFSLGMDFPRLWRHFDLTVEVSEWQNDWYVHFLYPDGLTNDGHVIGHWFGDYRQQGDAIGGSSQMLRAGWSSPSGQYWQVTYRTLANDPDWRPPGAAVVNYERAQILSLDLAATWLGRAVHAGFDIGQDVFGDSFARLEASLDFAERRIVPRAAEESDSSTSDNEFFIEAGTNYSSVTGILGVDIPNESTDWEPDFHLGVGARRRVSERSDFGVRLEVDRVQGEQLLSVRALDYRFRWTRRLALSGFFGVGRYEVGLPAYGYYWGAGVQYRDVLPGWDVGVDLRHHEKLGRDKVLPDDPPSTPDRTRLFFDVDGATLYVSRRW
jgi:hypothetical protein